MVVFAGIGAAVVVATHAATFATFANLADGLVSGNASIVSDTAAASGKAVRFGQANTSLPVRAMFYYPWFPEAWNQQGFNPFTNYTPTAGNYSSTDSAIITKHIDDMVYAGMNSAIFSWWGQGSKEDNRFQPFLDATGSKPLKWALYYECEGNGSGGTCGTVGGPSPSSANITSDLSYIKTKYANNSNYLKINSKPVIFVYGDGTDSCATATNWKNANANQGFYIVLKVFGGYSTCADQPDNWHQYGPASAEDVQGTHSISISPGYWKKGCPSGGGVCTQGDTQPYLARDLARWSTNVTDLKNSSAQLQLITTYNEWGEGSSVESANGTLPAGWQSASGHGQFIDTLHQILVSGTPVDNQPSVSLTAPAAGTVSGTVTMTASASDDHGVTKIEFLVDGTVVNTSGTNPASPYSFSWNSVSVAAGSHTVTARATDTTGQQTTSASVTVTVSQPDTTKPTVPGNFAATVPVTTSSTVHLAWTASTDSGGSGLNHYILSRNGTVIASPAASATSFDDSTTIFSTAYTYTIAAVDGAGNTSAAATATVTTPAPPADTQAPDVPTATASVVSTTQVTVSWTSVADNPKSGGTASGVKGYKIFRDGTQVADVLAPSTSTNDGPFSFVSGQSYSYTVLAYDVAGNASAKSAASSVTPNPVITSGKRCGNAATGNKIDTIVVISEENRTWSNVGGPGFSASTMPYTHGVAAECGFFQLDTEVNTGDNSAQQYVGAWTGFDSTVTHVSADCSPSTSCSTTVNNIFRAFRNAGIPHREYVEGATSSCSASGNAAKHIPDLYMWDPVDKAACSTEVLPMSQFNFASPPTGYTFITPTLCNDGHDCGDGTVDGWLKDPTRLPALFNTPAYKSGKVLVELWYDEDHPKPNLFACWSCKQFNSTIDPHYSGESLLWLNLLGASSTNMGGISGATDIRPILGTP